MSTQPEALRLAAELEDAGKPAFLAEATAAELRRLHAQRDALLEALNEYGRHHEECPYRRRRGFACNCGFLAAIAAVEEGK